MPSVAVHNLAVRDLAVATPTGEPLLEGIGFTLDGGAGLRLAGRSGVGKTMALRALAYLHPSGGTLALDGASPDELGPPAWRRKVTLVAQRPRLFEGTVEDELRRPFAYASAREPYDGERAREGLRALELPRDVLGRSARSLSVGEQQRVCLIRGLLHRPAFALLDEPTSALDAESRESVVAWLRRERAAGIGLVLVTHDPIELEELRVVDLDAHRIETDGVFEDA